MVDGGIDHAVLALRIAPGDGDQGGVVHVVCLAPCARDGPDAHRAIRPFSDWHVHDRRVTVPGQQVGSAPAPPPEQRTADDQ